MASLKCFFTVNIYMDLHFAFVNLKFAGQKALYQRQQNSITTKFNNCIILYRTEELKKTINFLDL